MTYDKTLFKDLKPTKVSNVIIGNGSYIVAKGKGTIQISTTSGIKTITCVLYVPNIDQNLLSVGHLVEKGFKISFKDQHCAIFDTTGLEILKVKMRLKSFSFDPSVEEQTTYFTYVSLTKLWHKRLGHCRIQVMLNMEKKDITRGLPVLSNHTDMARPQRTPSLQGNLYFILFIDDFTRMYWIFFLKFKHEVAITELGLMKEKIWYS